MLQLLEQSKNLGISIYLIEFFEDSEKSYHFYSMEEDKIYINLALNPTITDVVHEYMHYIQYNWCDRSQLIWEYNNIPYSKRIQEAVAFTFEQDYKEYLLEDGTLDKEAMAEFHNSVMAYFYENEEAK